MFAQTPPAWEADKTEWKPADPSSLAWKTFFTYSVLLLGVLWPDTERAGCGIIGKIHIGLCPWFLAQSS